MYNNANNAILQNSLPNNIPIATTAPSTILIDLRKYLQQNHNQLTWKQRINIIVNIINAILHLHQENSIHRDLHSGNILYSENSGGWYISDFGFCGPADKPLGSIYGNLPYIAPEVINGKGYTFASDIYSIGMLMWEISSGQPPFAHFDHDYELTINLLKGMRPQIVQGTPTEYKNLMIQCWDADPLKRYDIKNLHDKITEILKSFFLDLEGLMVFHLPI
ncbi:20089_t:CDS:2, partial [Funneliformis geosporum]